MFRRSACNRTRDLLSPYLDGRLDPAEAQKVEAHLQGCAACERELESLRATVSLLHLTPVVKPSRSFAIRQPVAAPRRWPVVTVLRWSTAVAAILLMVLVGSEVLSPVDMRSFTAPASAPIAQKSSGDRAVVPASESTGAGVQRTAPAPPTASASAPTSDPVPMGEPTMGAPLAATAPTPGARDAADTAAISQPPEAGQESRPIASSTSGLSILRIVEVGLGAIILALVAAGLVAGRMRRHL